MESEHVIIGKLVVGEKLDLSKINTEDCVSIASWNLNSTEEQVEELNEASKCGAECKNDAIYCVECLKEVINIYEEKVNGK